jgi:hypothetical protein
VKKLRRFRALPGLVLLATLSLVSCKSSSSPSTPTTPVASSFSVQGTIFYSTAPATDATVRVHLSPTGGPGPILQTDSVAAKYSFASIPQGDYGLWSEVIGGDYYQCSGGSITVDADVTQDLHLTKLFQATSPLDNAFVTTPRPILVWEKGPPETASYSILILYPWGELAEEAKDIPSLQYTVSKDLNNGGVYRWYVYAYDSQGTRIGRTEERNFGVSF